MAQRGTVSIDLGLRWVQRFATAEWPLVLPVALAFFGLPRLVAALLLGRQMAGVPQTMAALQAFSANLPPWWTPLLLAILLIALLGAMTLVALALRPGISVGEAILLALYRLPVCLAVLAMVGAALFIALVLLMTVVALLGGAQMAALALVLLGMIAVAILLLVLLPLIIVDRLGPIRAIAAGWRLYHGHLLRISGGLILFAVGAFIVGLAVQVSLGSMLLLLFRSLGRPEIGDVLTAIVSSLVAAVGWAGFYLLVAAFYRQRVS